KAATEQDRPAIELQLEQARGKFWQDQAEAQEIDGWVHDGIIAYPQARRKEITGRTQEAIMAEAKASHEDVQRIIDETAARVAKEKDEEAARQGWGTGGVGGGGAGQGARTGMTDQEQFEKDVNEAHDGLRRGTLTPLQGERLEKARIGVMADYFTDPNAVERARRRGR